MIQVMFDHIIKVAFVVPDVAEAVRFYTEKLDLEVEARFPSGAGPGEDFVFLKSKTSSIELMPEKAMAGAPIGFHHVAFLVDDVDKRLQELRDRNVKITAEAFAWEISKDPVTCSIASLPAIHTNGNQIRL